MDQTLGKCMMIETKKKVLKPEQGKFKLVELLSDYYRRVPAPFDIFEDRICVVSEQSSGWFQTHLILFFLFKECTNI